MSTKYIIKENFFSILISLKDKHKPPETFMKRKLINCLCKESLTGNSSSHFSESVLQIV